MQTLKDILFHVSNALLAPCLVLLVLLFARTLVHLGEFLREALGRRRRPARLADFASFVAERKTDPLAIEKRLDDTEAELTRHVEATALLSKIGPMLGLAGTLIPLGPALSGMSAGDVGKLASNLIVAFTTTVVGLAIAGPCYWVSSTRRRWYARDLMEMDHHYRSAIAAATEEA